MTKSVNTMHEGNRACWNGWATWWGECRDRVGVWQRCHQEPALVLSTLELSALGDVQGKDVCVLASGNNEVAFALAGMGANVTSVDISENQLAIDGTRRPLGIRASVERARRHHKKCQRPRGSGVPDR